ncbi:head-tail connector protein [Rhodovulum marinum]|uniref:Putative phiE125 gp8 family phage protein n=1 Tax=Rhodovulum marinum TaxID=320662 RepID=A0A4R2Q5N0_9RHOB|nr:phage head-tail connector protein [Rhodovulum marinum]TCP43937.1 putative phiE125 gp8 family phage protein [Rhodovulum marinum]
MPTRQTTPPAALPVTREELKAHLRITSTAEDDLLDGCLAAAIDEIDGTGLLGRAMISASYTLTRGPAAARDVELEIGPAQSLEAIAFVKADGSTVAGDIGDFALISDGERAFVRGDWPSGLGDRPDAISITYRAGFGDTAAAVPATLRHAVKLLAAHRFEVRDEVVIGTVATQIPLGVERLVNLNRVRVFG